MSETQSYKTVKLDESERRAVALALDMHVIELGSAARRFDAAPVGAKLHEMFIAATSARAKLDECDA